MPFEKQSSGVHGEFEQQVEKNPHAIAVASDEESITYRELNESANQLAHCLFSLGVHSEERVGLCMGRSLHSVVGMLGILKAGGAYVPLDDQWPRKRIANIIRDAGIRIVLTRSHLKQVLPLEDQQLLALNVDTFSRTDFGSDNPWIFVAPENSAYVMYTSGSTGNPNGVLVPHAGTINLARAQIRAFGIEPECKIFQFAPLTSDASVSEWSMALLSGASLILGTSGPRVAPFELQSLVHHDRVDVVTLPPSILKLFVPEDLKGLKKLIIAGELCPQAVIDEWSRGVKMYNAYGPTEATVCATISSLRDGSIGCPIGRPIDNVNVYVLDEQMRPVPFGVSGEMYIAGMGVARGYLNRPSLTAERFLPDPFSNEIGARFYRTGDRGLFSPDGELIFLGRLDQQVKINGYRVEFGEIESALRTNPTILDAVVFQRQENGAGAQLVAAVTARKGCDLAEAQVRAHMHTILPSYMIPTIVEVVPDFPLMQNGKIDRHSLSLPKLASVQCHAPLTDLEVRLAAIWAKVLRVESIEDNSDFFRLGGDSLGALQVVYRVREAFGVEIQLSTAFDYPTLSELAIIIKQQMEVLSSPMPLSNSAAGNK